MRAVIGLSAYEEPAQWSSWDTEAVLLHSWYSDAVRAANAVPVLLPPQEPEAAAVIVDRLDALVLTGGPDVDATLYNAAPLETNDEPRSARDAFEIALYRAARDAGLPVLGICRGLQVMAVAEGGALIQHLPEVSDVTHRVERGTFVDHEATFLAGSLAHDLFGDSCTVHPPASPSSGRSWSPARHRLGAGPDHRGMRGPLRAIPDGGAVASGAHERHPVAGGAGGCGRVSVRICKPFGPNHWDSGVFGSYSAERFANPDMRLD